MKKYVKAGFSIDHTGEVGFAYDLLLNEGISDEALKLITDIHGYSLDTLDDVCWARVGMSIYDMMEKEED